MVWIDIDDIWQKYSEDSRIEFACFDFHVLYVCLLSRYRLPNCMPKITRAYCALSQLLSALFLQHLRRISLSIICETDDRWIPHLMWNFSDCSVALWFVFLTQQLRLNYVDVYISMRTASAAAHDACRLLIFTSSL